MRLKKGKGSYRLPVGTHSVEEVLVDVRNTYYQLFQLDEQAFSHYVEESNLRGIPQYFYFHPQLRSLRIWPIPEKAWRLEVTTTQTKQL